jgi:hypothetical protein
LRERGSIKKCVKREKREKRGPFIEEEGGSPLGGWPAKERPLLLFMVLFIVVTPSSWW